MVSCRKTLHKTGLISFIHRDIQSESCPHLFPGDEVDPKQLASSLTELTGQRSHFRVAESTGPGSWYYRVEGLEERQVQTSHVSLSSQGVITEDLAEGLY